MDSDQLKAAWSKISDYLWHETFREYIHSLRDEQDCKRHIFVALVAMDNLVNGTDESPEDYVKRSQFSGLLNRKEATQ